MMRQSIARARKPAVASGHVGATPCVARNLARLTIRAALVAGVIGPVTLHAQGQFADVNGARLYYQDEGSGHPLVLIHGWPMSERMWDDQARVLSRYYRVIRYDRRGFGRSPGTPWKEGSPEHDLPDLEALLKYLGVTKTYVLGHSAGGSTAIAFTLAHPDQVDALILHGAVPGGFVLPEKGPFAEHDSIHSLLQSQGMPGVRRAWLAHPINRVPDDKPEVRARIAEIVEQYSGADILNSTPPPPPHLAAIYRLNTISVPTLVLVGGVDLPFFQISADVLTFEIPNAQKVVVRGGGHLVNMIEPELYNAEVLRFLRRVEREQTKSRPDTGR